MNAQTKRPKTSQPVSKKLDFFDEKSETVKESEFDENQISFDFGIEAEHPD